MIKPGATTFTFQGTIYTSTIGPIMRIYFEESLSKLTWSSKKESQSIHINRPMKRGRGIKSLVEHLAVSAYHYFSPPQQ